jgi:hypothetical protein
VEISSTTILKPLQSRMKDAFKKKMTLENIDFEEYDNDLLNEKDVDPEFIEIDEILLEFVEDSKQENSMDVFKEFLEIYSRN